MRLLYEIKKNPNLRRIFGKMELEILEKQLLGISLTQSEKNRLSRDIRKKFEAIKALKNFEDFKLKKGEHIKEIIEEKKEEILKDKISEKIIKIILYGSTATNNRTIRSDIDLAVEFDKIDSKDAMRFMIRHAYDDNIDVKVYNILSEKIKKEVDKYGKVIWKKK